MSKLAPSSKSTRTVTIARQAYLELLNVQLESVKSLHDARELEIEAWMYSPERKEEAKKLLVLCAFEKIYGELISFTLGKYLYPKLTFFQKIKWKWFFTYIKKLDYALSVGFNYPVEGFYDHFSNWTRSDDGLQKVYSVYQEYTNTTLTYDEFAQHQLDVYMAKQGPEVYQVICQLEYNWSSVKNTYSEDFRTLATLVESIDKVTDATFTISENEFINLTK